jgi:hypothetical protein
MPIIQQTAGGLSIGYTGSGVYPLTGLGWSMTDKPTFNTLTQNTAAGREVMNSLYLNPLHEFSLVFNVLHNDQTTAGNPDTDARMLFSFYYAQTGRYTEMLYQPLNSTVTHGPLALPDTNGYVELVYNTGPFFYESVQELNNATPTIYSVSGDTYTNITDTCTFYTADSVPPYSGIVFTTTTDLGADTLAWSGQWYYRVHFDKDSYDFEQFMYALYKTGVGLSQVRI